MSDTKILRALISVSNKTGVVDFTRALQEEFGVHILSTGGTARVLRDAGLEIEDVSHYTGWPEGMDGRVKTLHPMVHGGLLYRGPQDDEYMRANKIKPIDLLVVNLYPFEETIAKPDCTLDQAIEEIDIGGPAMIRAAAKNFNRVTVIVNPSDYPLVLEKMRAAEGATSLRLRLGLAFGVFETTAAYDRAIKRYIYRAIASP